MQLAILSDLHAVTEGFQHVARHAQQHNADHLIYLGDLGHDPALLSALRHREIACTFGNWEVSGLSRLPAPWAEWVAAWPARIERGAICFTHATPDMPPAVTTTADAVAYMAQQKISWNTLFPRLHNNEEARWNALAALATHNQRAAFHGHTHIQQTWVYQAKRWRCFDGPAEFTLEKDAAQNDAGEEAACYLIGVGSAGAPQDGEALRYALYDEESGVVRLVALPAR